MQTQLLPSDGKRVERKKLWEIQDEEKENILVKSTETDDVIRAAHIFLCRTGTCNFIGSQSETSCINRENVNDVEKLACAGGPVLPLPPV